MAVAGTPPVDAGVESGLKVPGSPAAVLRAAENPDDHPASAAAPVQPDFSGAAAAPLKLQLALTGAVLGSLPYDPEESGAALLMAAERLHGGELDVVAATSNGNVSLRGSQTALRRLGVEPGATLLAAVNPARAAARGCIEELRGHAGVDLTWKMLQALDGPNLQSGWTGHGSPAVQPDHSEELLVKTLLDGSGPIICTAHAANSFVRLMASQFAVAAQSELFTMQQLQGLGRDLMHLKHVACQLMVDSSKLFATPQASPGQWWEGANAGFCLLPIRGGFPSILFKNRRLFGRQLQTTLALNSGCVQTQIARGGNEALHRYLQSATGASVAGDVSDVLADTPQLISLLGLFWRVNSGVPVFLAGERAVAVAAVLASLLQLELEFAELARTMPADVDAWLAAGTASLHVLRCEPSLLQQEPHQRTLESALQSREPREPAVARSPCVVGLLTGDAELEDRLAAAIVYV